MLLEFRPEGPAVPSPGRKAGELGVTTMSAEGAALIFSREFLGNCAVIPVRCFVAGKYLCVRLHLVWSTKGRRCLIDSQWRHRLHGFIGSVARYKNATAIEAGSQPDHVHLYVSMPSTISVAELVNAIKANSTRWVRQTFANRRLFAWQEGYGAFSVSKSLEEAVIDYIRKQDEHHKRRDFQQELLELLGRHAIEYDPRYVFD